MSIDKRFEDFDILDLPNDTVYKDGSRSYEEAVLGGDQGLVGGDIFVDTDNEWRSPDFMTSAVSGRLATQRAVIEPETLFDIGVGEPMSIREGIGKGYKQTEVE